MAPITIATVSGKGGVGKTTVTIGIAHALRKLGYKVGVIDLDLESSSLGDAMGVDREKLELRDRIEPAKIRGMEVVSLSLFPEKDFEDVPTLIDEQRVYGLVRQLFRSVNWGELDFIVVDLCPGSGPELRGLIRQSIDGLILVAATQRLSEMPVRRLVRMAREEYRLRILGVVSNNPYNMTVQAGGTDSGQAIVERYDLPLLATIPWDRAIAGQMDDRKQPPLKYFTPIAEALRAEFFPEPEPVEPETTETEEEPDVGRPGVPETGNGPDEPVHGPEEGVRELAEGQDGSPEGVQTAP